MKTRKHARYIKRKFKNLENVEEKIHQRKEKRIKRRKTKRKGKKTIQKQKCKKERKPAIEKSLLGKAIPEGRVSEFKKGFLHGKIRTSGVASLRFLQNLDFPFSDLGNLKKDFRQIVKERVINKLPDYCEEIKMEKSQKMAEDCRKRAKRIKERVIKRLKQN